MNAADLASSCHAATVAPQPRGQIRPATRSESRPPRLSVVIASINGREVLEPTLDALDAQTIRDEMEILVVEAVGGATRAHLAERLPVVRVIPVQERMSIPRLRALGGRAATGDVVAILEDHVAVVPGWAEAIVAAFEQTDDPTLAAVGGPVLNGRRGWVDRAAFLTEYTPFLPPLQPRDPAAVPNLAGNNIAYRRAWLERHLDLLEQGRWESWINAAILRQGGRLEARDAAAVRHIKPFTLADFLTQRFWFCRSFAGMRRADQSPVVRLIHIAGSPLLPALLLARIARAVWIDKRPGHRADFLACLPLILLFLTVGAAGELVGYLWGTGGSLERVE